MSQGVPWLYGSTGSLNDELKIDGVFFERGWMQRIAATPFSSARADCEWSRRWQTGSVKHEHGGWQLLVARGWRGFCLCEKAVDVAE